MRRARHNWIAPFTKESYAPGVRRICTDGHLAVAGGGRSVVGGVDHRCTVNLRFVIFSAASRSYFITLPWRQRLLAGNLNGDLGFALF